MRNLGLFTSQPVDSSELLAFSKSFADSEKMEWNHQNGTITLRTTLGAIYLLESTALANGCSDDEELRTIQATLGSVPVSYVDLHFTSTPGAFSIAKRLALAIQQKWPGAIDYSGAGGTLGTPPPAQ